MRLDRSDGSILNVRSECVKWTEIEEDKRSLREDRRKWDRGKTPPEEDARKVKERNKIEGVTHRSRSALKE